MTPRFRPVALPGWQSVEPWQVLAIDRERDESAAWGDHGRLAQEWFDRGELEFEPLAQEWFDRGELEFETARAAAEALPPERPRGLWQRLRSVLYGEPGPTLDLAASEG